MAACSSGQSLAPPARGRRGREEEGRTGITYPDGSVVARQYTARDQLSQIDYNTDMVATFAYDAGFRRTSRVLGDTPGTQTAWVYGPQCDVHGAADRAIPDGKASSAAG